MEKLSLTEKISKNLHDRPKRILSLDGGGVRGILTLGILHEIETLLKNKYGNSYEITDHYDLIGGTSTGAIIAAGLATGKSVTEIIKLYQDLGVKIFGNGMLGWAKRSNKTLRSIRKENYSSAQLENFLKGKNTFGELTFGDSSLKCGLVINAKRADTYSLWTVTNHPNGIFYNTTKDTKIWELCRASSAAPYYFKPKKLEIKSRNGKKQPATFIDGGVSLANQPAWQLFLAATVKSFGFDWKHGEDSIHITSIGTGVGTKKENANQLADQRSIKWLPNLSELFMVDALEMNHVLMMMFGENIGPQINGDSQLGDMSERSYVKEKLFSFARYNVSLDVDYLKDELNLDFSQTKVESIREMDHYENMDDLLLIGASYARKVEFAKIL